MCSLLSLIVDVEHLHWAQTLRDAFMAINADLHWECRANGKPQPVYKWLKNGQATVSEVRNFICYTFNTPPVMCLIYICQMNLFDEISMKMY